MTLKRICLIGVLFVACMTGYLMVRNAPMTADPASSMAGFFLFRAHCPMPSSQPSPPTANTGYLHLFQANGPF
jgi:hypothetical protein